MQYPTPHPAHSLYPNYSPGGDDWRWYRTRYADVYPQSKMNYTASARGVGALQGFDVKEDEERTWIGPILCVFFVIYIVRGLRMADLVVLWVWD